MNCMRVLLVVDAALDLADFERDVGQAVVDVHLQELGGEPDRRLEVGRLEHGVAADDFLGFGEGAVGRRDLAAVALEPRALFGAA